MINLSKEDINILMNLISEKIVDMKSRQNEIDLNKFEKIILGDNNYATNKNN